MNIIVNQMQTHDFLHCTMFRTHTELWYCNAVRSTSTLDRSAITTLNCEIDFIQLNCKNPLQMKRIIMIMSQVNLRL